MPKVVMRLVNTGTETLRAQLTDDTGLYRFTLLDAGVYRLEAEAPGFKKFSREGIQLATGETTTLDVSLEIGQMAEAITVTSESPLLRTETGGLGTSVNTQVINELPLIGRNPYVFLKLSPGIQYTGDPSAINPWDNFGPSDFSSSGSKARSEFLLDGIPNMRIDIVSFSPSPDAVQEMRAQTNTYDAEYGHSGSAFVNVSTKSGANTPHGAVYWYLRNDNVNANDFFNNRNGRPKNEFKQNTYGAAAGGPAYLPKIYNGRDRTFYFFDFEGTRIRGTSFNRAIVPSVPQRSGDFSQTLDRNGSLITIYDPLTTRSTGPGVVRAPFPGNVVPKDRQDPVAMNSLKYYPLPNRTPTATNLQNFELAGISGRNWASLSSRVDHQISAAHSLFFRYGWNHRTDPADPFYGPCCKPAGNPTSGQDIFARGNIAAGVGYTWVKGPRTVVDFRLGFTRYFEANIMFGEGFDLASLGFPASFGRAVAFSTFPRFEMSGDLDNLGAGRTTQRAFISQYNPLFNVHTNIGRHAVKYGFRYQVAQQNQFNPQRSGGYFKFERAFTQGPDPTRSSSTAGFDFASFLLGASTRGYTDVNVAPALENKFFAFYAQDDWKVTDRLTLNLGLRFEREGPVTDRFDQGSAGYDFTVASPIESQVKANYARNPIPELADIAVRGGLRFLNVDGAPRGNLSTSTLLYAPRFGYAYRVSNRMVWRGGYGIFYLPNNVANYRQDGFSLATQMVTSLDNNLTPFNRLADPFPNGLVRPPGAAGGLLTAAGQNLTAGATVRRAVPNYLNGLSQQFSMGFQFVLPAQLSVDASYVGNVSQRLTITRDVDQYANAYLDLKNRLNARVPNPFYGVITDPTSALSQATTTVAQLLKPYPHFLGLTQAVLPFGRSHYDSFQLQVTRRMARGLYFGAVYNLSKYMEAMSYLNANDAKPASVISDADRPQRLVLHGIYELPFGPGKAWFRSSHPLARRIAAGWQFNWVVTYQSMDAIAFTGAERLFRSTKDPHTVDEWFEVKQFASQEPFTLRRLSARVADLRNPGIKKWDLTLMKRVSITERVEWKLQAEFYNAWNTTHFGTPNTTVTSANFGRITSTLIGPREIQLASRVSW